MSDLLNSASLVMIPSGYKEDTVYSVVPSDGSGDLSFTRASNGTRINSAGLVEVCPWNLILQSETFNNSYWNKVNGTITSDSIVAPNGTTTADLFTITNNSAFVEKTIAGTGTLFTFIPNTQYTFSCYFKKGSIDYNFKMLMYDGVSVTNSGTINLTTPSSSTVSYEDVGNGWYRFYHTFTSSASATTGYFYAVNYDYSTTITSGTNVYLWGAQVVQGATAKPYFPTTDRLNVPRLTYQNGGGGCPSLLLEKQSTNIVLYSEDFSNVAWQQQQITLSANATISPDGTQNADSVIPTTANSALHRLYENGSNSIATASYSIFVKPNGYYRVAFRESATTGAAIGFDLLNETIITTYSTGGCTASGGKIENMGNGWYRISGIFSFASATAQSLGLYVVSPSWTSGDPENVAWAGNGTSGVYLYGAQLEASSYATSYIPTTSSSATRVADACFKTGISSLIGQTEGVLFADVNWNVQAESGSPVVGILTLNNNVANLCDCIILGIERQSGGNNRVYCLVQNSCSTQAALFGSNITNGRYKIALGYKANDFVLYVNGVQIATDTSGTVPTTSEVLLGIRFQGDSVNLNDTINEAVVFKTRLTNSELAQLTGNQNYTINQAYASYGVASESPNCVQP